MARRLPPEAIDAEVEAVFVKLAGDVASGSAAALNRLRLLHQAIVDREEQGETLSRLLPGGLAERLQRDAGAAGPIGVARRQQWFQANQHQRIFCGVSTATTGAIHNAVTGHDGYLAAKEICESVAACGPSPLAHMCTANEMAYSIQIGANPPNGSNVWIATLLLSYSGASPRRGSADRAGAGDGS